MATLADFQVNNTHEFCEHFGLDQASVAVLLNYIRGPFSLHRFYLVAISLRTINPILNTDNLRAYLPEKAILALHDVSKKAKQIFEDVSQKTWVLKGAPRPHNLIEYYPEYAMLSSPDVQYPSEWKSLKSELTCIVLIVCHEYRQMMVDRKLIINSGVKSATREVRELEVSDKRPVILPPSWDAKNSLEIYLNKFITYTKEQTSDAWGHGIRLLFESYLDQKSLIPKSGYAKTKSYSDSVVSISDEALDLPNTPVETQIFKSGKPLKDLEKSGLNQGELQGSRYFKITEKSNKSYAVLSTRKQVQIQRARFNAIKSTNQLLLYSWQSLSPYELYQLVTALQKPPNLPLAIPFEALRASILIMLWTGRPLDEVINTRVAFHKSIKNKTNLQEICWVKDKKYLATPVYGPAYKNTFDQTIAAAPEVDGKKHHQTGLIILRLPNLATKSIDDYVASIQEESLFNFDLQELNEYFSLFFACLNKNSCCDLRFSIRRLSRVMPFALKATQASLGDIKLITNQSYTHADNSLHYLHTTPQSLELMHRRASDWLKGFISGEPTQTLKGNQQSIENRADYIVGGRYQLTPKLAKWMTGDLKLKVNQARQQYLHANGSDKTKALVNFHNLLTYYTTKFLHFCSGYRSVCDPLESLHLIDIQTGFLSISDKDDDSYSQSRIVPLPPKCIEQLSAYQMHIDALKSATSSAALIQHVNQLQQDQNQAKLGFLFYLDEALNPKRVIPSYLENINEHNLPDNIYRHFLRTQLQISNVSPEFISYFLGHWEVGEEPFQRYSAISPLDLAEYILPITAQLAKDAGWQLQFGLRS